jgi:hypothetical protein
MAESHSITVRLQRITKEAAQVSVPITSELTTGQKLDTTKVMQAALALGAYETTGWEADGEPTILLHPLQLPPK